MFIELQFWDGIKVERHPQPFQHKRADPVIIMVTENQPNQPIQNKLFDASSFSENLLSLGINL
jgi:hypothetical protein